MPVWPFGSSPKGDPITAARQAARKAIDKKNAKRVASLASSKNPLKALATSLEFNIDWGCCRRVDMFTNVPVGQPGRLVTLGNEFFCTHCDIYSVPFDLYHYESWLSDPSHSTAGPKRFPPTPEDSGNWGYEAVQLVLAGLDALKEDDPDQYLALCRKNDRLSLRILHLKLDTVLEHIKAPVVARIIGEARPISGHLRVYQRLLDTVNDRMVTAEIENY